MISFDLHQNWANSLVSVDRLAVNPTVYGVGFNDVGFRVKIDGKMLWQYQLWKTMLRRCLCSKCKTTSPTYKDVTCCDEWLSFGNFLAWCNKETGYSGLPEGFHLDKDIIVKGNKIYSPEACSFVPRNVNMLLNDNGAARGDWPVGVSLYKRDGRFNANIKCWGKLRFLGRHDTPEGASAAYKIAKEAHVKIVATQHRDSVKPAVYEALMNWKVEE